MAATTTSFAEFFVRVDPVFFEYVASYFAIDKFVAVHEAFTSCAVFRQVWHSRIKGVMRRIWPLIEDKKALHWLLDRGINVCDWQLKLPGCKQGGESFTELCKDEEWRLVRATMERTGVDMNTPYPERIPFLFDSIGSVPLHCACGAGVLNICKLLVEKGADLNARNDDNRTPLHYVARKGHLNVVKYLVEQGANMEAVAIVNMTPLHIAAHNDSLNIVKYLVEQGANKEAVDNGNSTPLHFAASNDHLDVVKYLVEQGANKEAVADDNFTPLHYAVGKGHFNIVKYLVEQGANKEELDSAPLCIQS